jgi:ribosomal protein S18 acetylase RimI-like enzyme
MSASVSNVIDIPVALQGCATLQEFESKFFRGPVWRLMTVPDRRQLPLLLDFFEASGTKLAMFRIDAGLPGDAELLSASGFRCVETLLTLACDMTAAGDGQCGGKLMPAMIRTATIDDVGAVERIAMHAFTHDRFHADACVADDVADAIKAAWAGNDVKSRADAVFVATASGEVVGFNACLRRADTATIDLIAVAPSAQGKGFGRRLLKASLDHYQNDIRIMYVGTQSSNASSLALYQAHGFQIIRSERTFHWTPSSAHQKR